MNNKSMKELRQDSYLNGGSSAFIEQLYEDYLTDPSSIDDSWRAYFDELGGEKISHQSIKDHFQEALQHPAYGCESSFTSKDYKVLELINAYRKYGHQGANLDPIQFGSIPECPALDLSYYGLSNADLNTSFAINNFANLGEEATLAKVLEKLKQIYSHHIGYEFTQAEDVKEIEWFQQQIEDGDFYKKITNEEKVALLKQLVACDGLEKFLGNKFVGQKRFSLEGGDALIPMLNGIIENSGHYDTQEIVMGMAHRGRINVLANVVGKPVQTMLNEFEGISEEESSVNNTTGYQSQSGDVKYHLGYSSDIKTSSGHVVHLALAFNPSHLDFVCPVVEGSVRARQARRQDESRNQVLPILIHGDSSFIGQGVNMEVFTMSQARGYATGGTVHIIINNQIGFTTSNPKDTRSTLYCSDLAKMVNAPVLHVNGDDPEAVMFVCKLALEYRMQFNKDVVIDLVCYRRFGHQEVDEPSATQPLMYQIIKKHPEPYKLYAAILSEQGVIQQGDEKTFFKACHGYLEQSKGLPNVIESVKNEFSTDWSPHIGKTLASDVETGVSAKTLKELGTKLDTLPDGMTLQPQVKKMMGDRVKMTQGEVPINWGYAEILAYATLVAEGTNIRLSGEDCERGTFSHRHAVLHDYKNGDTYTGLKELNPNQNGSFTVVNSVLSELGVLGFEYGYACSSPDRLVIWEAQFGDFANGAQVIFDQFISSGEQKWGRLCGLTMLLPHGHEGMGPEHSSARLERYLQLCAQENMQVCVPTTPAQIFHLLRRQVMRAVRKPLIIMSPKSLLRHPLATSSLAELTKGTYQRVIPEIDDIKAAKVTRVVLCSGKVYYDLLAKRREEKIDHIAIVRIEQLYPFPKEQLSKILSSYKNANEVIWCQEEPRNQGAWYQSQHNFREALTDSQTLTYAGRAPAAAPAAGSAKIHHAEQADLVNQALDIEEGK